MELGEINSGESSKNQLVEIQIEGNIQFLYNKNKISLKSFHSPFPVSKMIFALECTLPRNDLLCHLNWGGK